jgi:hypothetical protein
MSDGEKIHVFIDTSFLKGVSWRQNADLNKMLKFAQEGKIVLYISTIALDEFRTLEVEQIMKSISDVENAFNELQVQWGRCMITDGLEPLNNITTCLLEEQVIKENAKKVVDEIVSKNRIEIVQIDVEHAPRVFAKYFSWDRPFHNDGGNKADKQQREARKKHLPDAFIVEAALTIRDKMGCEVLCLTRDDNMKKTFEHHGIQVFLSATDVIKKLEPPISESNKEDAHNSLEQNLERSYEKQKELKIRILGYVKFFDSLRKDYLHALLINKGYYIELIENVVRSLILEGFLKDTGHYYIPVKEEICEEAKNRILPEILELIDKEE